MTNKVVYSAAFLVDDSTGKIVGVKDADGVEHMFVFPDSTETQTNKTLTEPLFNLMKLDATDALTAVGTDRATALQLTTSINNITTAASGTGVALPSSGNVSLVIVNNLGANAIKVYGYNTATVDGNAATTGVTLTNTKRAIFVRVATAKWISFMGVAAA